MGRSRRNCVIVAGLVVALAACGSGGSKAGGTQTITVFAAASLTGTFTELGKQFEAEHPGTKVTFSFGASSTLATQITQGAPADVFAAANTTTMQPVTKAGEAVGRSPIFAKNRLEIAVPKGNPAHIQSLAAFGDPRIKTVLCATQVPCGSAAAQVFKLAGITPKPVTYAADVKAALSQVALGEADAALVYRTDILAAGDKVQGLDFPESKHVINEYPIVVLKASAHQNVAREFVSYVLSANGRTVLEKAGFEAP
jgi:molybdate transport system substrate-binding protein